MTTGRLQLLRIDTVADMLAVSRRSVYRLLEDGALQGCRILGSTRVPEEEVFRFVREQVEKFELDG